MRSIFSLMALFSVALSWAQAPIVTSGCEPARGELPVYPSAAEAAAADGGDNRYLTRLSGWEQQDGSFSISFTRPFAWANRQVIFRLGWASSAYELLLNGEQVAFVANPTIPAEVDLTRWAAEGRNRLEVRLLAPSPVAALESWRTTSTPMIGPSWVLSRPVMHMRDVLVVSRAEGDAGDVTAEVGVVMRSGALNPRTSRLCYELLTPSGEIAASGYKDLTLSMRGEDTVRFLARIPSGLLWRAESPTHYTLRLKTRHEGRYVEYAECRLGFRTAEFRGDGLLINGEPVVLRVREVRPGMITETGLARLREQGYNAVRLLPGTFSESLLAMCDEQGMYVIAQAPVDTSLSGPSRRRGGNPSNDPSWREAFVSRVVDSYRVAARHPSVVAFSLAGESSNGINLYESYLEMKRLCDSRPVVYLWADGEWNTDPLRME